MSLFGKILAAPFEILNVPARAMEDLVDTDDEDRILSKPLDVIAKNLKQVGDDKHSGARGK